MEDEGNGLEGSPGEGQGDPNSERSNVRDLESRRGSDGRFRDRDEAGEELDRRFAEAEREGRGNGRTTRSERKGGGSRSERGRDERGERDERSEIGDPIDPNNPGPGHIRLEHFPFQPGPYYEQGGNGRGKTSNRTTNHYHYPQQFPPYANWQPQPYRRQDYAEDARPRHEREYEHREQQPWRYMGERMPRDRGGDYGHYPQPPWLVPGDNPGHGKGQGQSQGKEKQSMDGEKVSVNLGAGGFGPLAGGHGGGDGSNAALLALLAMGQNNNHNCGGGFGDIGGLAALALLGGGFGRSGDGIRVDCGRGHCGDHDVLEALGDIKGAVPQVTANIQNGITTLALAMQQGFTNNGDKILGAIAHLSDKISASEFASLQRELGVAQVALAEERQVRRNRDVEINVTQNVAQAQQQQQFQVQFDDFRRRFEFLCGQVQRVNQGQDIVNLGTMTASGTQAAQSTQVK